VSVPAPSVSVSRRGGAMGACPVHSLRGKLRQARLRPTRQRIALGWLLFGRGNRHLTAEMLFEEARAAKLPVSLATVYNTLHQFTAAGLLREIAVEGARAYFDTNPTPHHHFLIEETGALIDIPDRDIAMGQLPSPPSGCEVASVDVVVRVRRLR
jgi:Fur family transcriptional regulator, iron response regulator